MPDDLIQDTRERTPLNGATRKQLQVSDLHIGDVLGIERKTPSDFVSSLADGRLFAQATELRQNFRNAFILVEGNLSDLLAPHVRRRFAPAAIMGAVASLCIRHGVPVIFSGKYYPWLAHILATKATDSSPVLPYNPIRRNPTLRETAISVLAALPHIGPRKAESILYRYGSLQEALAHVPRWHEDVEGIGPKISKTLTTLMTEHHNGSSQSIFQDDD